ncbi:hypothetical protein LRS74_24655 [Streptomyces sp. LX-29]|uniref:hypothetical protein n=1 Tax=Streptomyces sp. LX-29 TaxID=2900152 RepID=UPI00240D113B|nr:hypothetical protein [Streptomyces sp. LX-29]WFB11988.1 hypothetical protein LRS74_24655 [Streptomyces sp. LX-29]
MPRAPQSPTAAWGGRLVLLAALLFGIVTMHTLGHPTGHGSGGQDGSHATAAHHGNRAAHEGTAGEHVGRTTGEHVGRTAGVAVAADAPHAPHPPRLRGAAHPPHAQHGSHAQHASHRSHGSDGSLAMDSAADAGTSRHPATASAAGPGASYDPGASVDEPGHGGLHPLSVCLAVLATWSAALLAVRLLRLARRLAVTAPGAPRASLPYALWPMPPPRGTRLTQLSVLRV